MESQGVRGTGGWDIYTISGGMVLSKQCFDLRLNQCVAFWSQLPNPPTHTALCRSLLSDMLRRA